MIIADYNIFLTLLTSEVGLSFHRVRLKESKSSNLPFARCLRLAQFVISAKGLR